MMLVDLLLEMVTQLTFAENHEPRVGQLLDHQLRRIDQVALSLVRHQRRHVADHGRAVGQPERFVHVDRRHVLRALDVDPFVHRHGAIGWHAVADEHQANGFRGGDEAVDLAILPAGERVALEVEIDAPRRHERRHRHPLGGR